MFKVERENNQGARLVERGQICFGLFIAVCVALHPGFVLKWNEGGMSDYGSHIETALPYTLALLGLAEFSRRAASSYRQNDRTTRRLRRVLYSYSVIVFVMLISTYVYTLNVALRDFHFGFGTVLILFEVSASVWMFLLFRQILWDGIFLAMQITGSIISLVTIVGALHVLFFSEILTGAGFAGLIIHTQSLCQLRGRTFCPRSRSRYARRYFITFTRCAVGGTHLLEPRSTARGRANS